jgi:hypothetical protein
LPQNTKKKHDITLRGIFACFAAHYTTTHKKWAISLSKYFLLSFKKSNNFWFTHSVIPIFLIQQFDYRCQTGILPSKGWLKLVTNGSEKDTWFQQTDVLEK